MRGGRRPGAGRPKGALTKRTQAIAERAAREGITPLEVMLRAMREHFEAGRLDEAARIAKDAAPYMHARVPATAIAPGDLPSLKHLTIRQLQQLLVDLEEGEFTDIPDQEARAQNRGRTQPLEGPQEQPPTEPSNGSRPRR